MASFIVGNSIFTLGSRKWLKEEKMSQIYVLLFLSVSNWYCLELKAILKISFLRLYYKDLSGSPRIPDPVCMCLCVQASTKCDFSSKRKVSKSSSPKPWNLTFEMCHITCAIWHVSFYMCHFTCAIWHLTLAIYIWHLTFWVLSFDFLFMKAF